MSVVAEMLKENMDAAYSDPRAAIMAAMLTHRFPLIARGKQGLSIDYDSLLRIGMRSNDPEILTSTGEALIEGKWLARDIRQGMRYFARANKTSAFMGAFMIARVDILQHRPIAIRMLKRARQAGHIPSAILLERLRVKRMRKFGLPAFLYELIYSVKCGRQITAGLKNHEDLYMHFWRYKDVIPATYQPLAEALPVDRASPFEEIKQLQLDS